MKRIVFVVLLMFISFISKSQDKTLVTVSADGTGDFKSIQEAIDATKAFPSERMTIFVKTGVYKEKVLVPDCNSSLSIIGENKDKTIVRYGDHFKSIARGRNSTFYTATFLVQGNDFVAENITFENTAGEVGQAIALAVEADRCVFRNCRIIGNQDALYTAGENCRQYYRNCYIEGTTDFIFGQATAFFEGCTIHSKSNSFITAASTPRLAEFGYVFYKCNLTSAPMVNSVYLGRPWRSYAKTVFIECNLGRHIRSEGWHPWTVGSGREKTSYYAEFGNIGEGADLSGRVVWCHQLSRREARKYTVKNVLSAKEMVDEEAWFDDIK